MLPTNTVPQSRSKQLQSRKAVLWAFCDPMPEACFNLRQLSRRDWQQLLHWLDTSGLALYFLDRLIELKQSEMLPPDVLARLQQNLADNTTRTESMIAESVAIQRDFQNAGLSYATLKGFSLWPHSVPRPELRSQLDLDFLMAENSADQARRILEGRGYHLRAISGRSWEFKTNERPGTSLNDLYKDVPHRSAELHIETNVVQGRSVLARGDRRCFRGICMPVLSPIDLFLGQGLHLFKHVCSEFSRTAHLIEFRRHVIARSDDAAFWSELRALAEVNPKAPVALGVVTMLITRVMGTFAPEAFTAWTVDSLPSRARLWVDLYAERLVFASFPGSKVYLLLQKELEASGVAGKRSLRRALVPLSLPPLIVHAKANETLFDRVRRYRTQLWFFAFRLRFHTTEGFRYLYESARWHRLVNELAS